MLRWFLTIVVAGYVAGVGINAAVLHLRHPEQPFWSALEESMDWPDNLIEMLLDL